MFDTDPELTAGCSYILICYVVTPYRIVTVATVGLILARNCSPGVSGVCSDIWAVGGKSAATDTGDETDYVFAKWTPTVSVPEPPAFWLMVIGLLILAYLLRRERSHGVAEV